MPNFSEFKARKEAPIKLGRRQYTLIVLTFISVMLVVLGCGLPILSTNLASNWLGPDTSVTFNNPALIPETPPDLAETDIITPAWLGISGATVRPEIAQAMNLPTEQSGVLVHFVDSYSPAQQAGIQGSDTYVTSDEHRWLVGGDIITTFDEQPINSMRNLHTMLQQAEPGQEITLTILRDGSQISLPTTLAPLPDLQLTPPASGLQIT